MLRFLMHYGIHFILPVIVAALFYRKRFGSSAIILLAGILIDIDHLWANPVFDPTRCSINFHLFHTYPFILLYLSLLWWEKSRIFGWALLIHILADSVDCMML